MGSVPLFSHQVAAAVCWGLNRDTEMAQLFQTQATKMRVVSSAQLNALTRITGHNSTGEYCLSFIPSIDLSSVITLFTYLLVLKLWQEIRERIHYSAYSGAARGGERGEILPPSPILGPMFDSNLLSTATFHCQNSIKINNIHALEGPCHSSGVVCRRFIAEFRLRSVG